MPRRHTVEQLPKEQFDFVIEAILQGETDREISLHFEDQFKTKLSKSSLARWRKTAGEELAERYRIARFQAKQLIEDAKLEPDVDKYQVFIDGIEDRLLTATREVMLLDPVKAALIQQEEKRRILQEKTLALKERQQTFAEEQAKRQEQLQHDRFKIGADTWQFILSYLLKEEPRAADLLTKHSEEILNGLEEHLESQAV